MRAPTASICLALCGVLTVGNSAFPKGPEKGAAFSFSNVPYFHRYSKNEMHLYTPSGQDYLKAWKDMVTINRYPKVKDGKALAATASVVLERYKAAGGMAIQAVSISKDKSADYLIVGIFSRPGFLEASFVRFRMHKGVGMSVTYSHHIYGKGAWDAMIAWVEKNSVATMTNLVKWDQVPKLNATK